MNVRLNEALKIKGIKQAELSKRSGISKAAVSSYISGRYKPKQDTIYQLAKVLDVSEMWLMGFDVPMERAADQKENDKLIDVISRIRKEKEFRNIIFKINALNSSQMDLIKNLLQQLN